MAEQDGRGLTGLVYKMSSSERWHPDVPYHERSGRALREAVRSLRKEKDLSLEQWVNFVP